MIEIFLNPHNDLYFSFSEEINYIRSLDPENVKGAENALLDTKSKVTDHVKFMG